MNTPSDWIGRIRWLANGYKCTYEQINVPDMRRLLALKRVEEKKSLSFSHGRIIDKIKLLEQVMLEKQDTVKALNEYAAMLERVEECRRHLITLKRDTEIIDYIQTGIEKGKTL